MTDSAREQTALTCMSYLPPVNPMALEMQVYISLQKIVVIILTNCVVISAASYSVTITSLNGEDECVYGAM